MLPAALRYQDDVADSDQVIGLTLIGQDITELAEYRMILEMKIDERTRELRRALKKEKEVVEVKSRFVSIASHEFRLPLSSIQFQANLIRQTKEQISHHDLEKRLDSIEQQVLHMNVLLDDVLTYGKSDAEKFPLVLSNIVITEFLSKIIEEVSNFCKKSAHAIITEYSLMPVVITTDERLLRSILINLLTNAITFSAWAWLPSLPSQMASSYGSIYDSTTDCYVLYLDKANQELRFKLTDVNGKAARPGIPRSGGRTRSAT